MKMQMFRDIPEFAPLQNKTRTELGAMHRDLKAKSNAKIIEQCKQAHLAALQKKGVKWLKTGWGFFGPIEFFFVLPAEIRLDNLTLSDESNITDTADTTVGLLKLKTKVLIKIFNYLDPNEEEGCLGLALSCKRLASVAVLAKVKKTHANLQSLGWSQPDKKWCGAGCGKNRKLARGYWKEVEKELKEDWDTDGLDLEKVGWDEAWEKMINLWQEGKNTIDSKMIPQACTCPACSAQMRWEPKENAAIFLKAMTTTDRESATMITKSFLIEFLLEERGIRV